MIISLALGLCAASFAAGISGPSVRDAGDVALDPADVSPLAARGPFWIINFETNLCLEHPLTTPNDTGGYPVRAVPFTSKGDRKLHWYTVTSATPVGLVFTIHTNATQELGIFVNSAVGNTPSVRALASQFLPIEGAPANYRIILPLTKPTLALTAPNASGSPPTLQRSVDGNSLQEWHMFN